MTKDTVHVVGPAPAKTRLRIAALVAGVLACAMVGGPGLGSTLAAYSDVESNDANTFQAASSYGPSCNPAGPSLYWFTGIENGAISTPGQFNSNFAVQADSAVSRTGAYSLRASKTAGGSSLYITKSVGISRPVVSLAIRLAALPASDVESLFKFDMPTTADLMLGYQAATQRLTLRWNGISSAVANTQISAGQWVGIDFKVDTSANPNTATWALDGIDQGTISAAQAAISVLNLTFGSQVAADGFTAHYDDIILSPAPADFPLGAPKVYVTRPDGMGASSNPGHFDQGDGTPVDANTWTLLDDATTSSSTDVVRQVTPSAASYLEVTFADTAVTCVEGVTVTSDQGKQGSQTNVTKTSIFDGAIERIVHSGDSGCGNCTSERIMLLPTAGARWTPAELNGLVARIGYASDNAPVPAWNSLLLEYIGRP